MSSERVLVTIDPKQVADLKEFVRQELAKDRAGAPPATLTEQAVNDLRDLRMALRAYARELDAKTGIVPVPDITAKLRNLSRGVIE